MDQSTCSKNICGRSLLPLFVYGTLKRGYRNSSLMNEHYVTFLKEVRTVPEFRLIDFGSFPGLTTGNKAIEGELYHVDSWYIDCLDRFEGCGGDGVYTRQLVTLEDGSHAYAYICNSPNAPEYEGTNWHERVDETVVG